MTRLTALRRFRRYWPAALALTLAMLLLLELVGAPAAPPARQAGLPVLQAAQATPAAATAGAVATILARPLFRAGRRPVALVSVAVDFTLPRLSAIVITAAGRSAIFIADDGTASVVAAGGRIGAYQLRRITPDSVSLDGPNGAVTMHPQFAAGSGTPGGPAGGNL